MSDLHAQSGQTARACGVKKRFEAMREVGLRLPAANVVCEKREGHAGSHEGQSRSTAYVWADKTGASQ